MPSAPSAPPCRRVTGGGTGGFLLTRGVAGALLACLALVFAEGGAGGDADVLAATLAGGVGVANGGFLSSGVLGEGAGAPPATPSDSSSVSSMSSTPGVCVPDGGTGGPVDAGAVGAGAVDAGADTGTFRDVAGAKRENTITAVAR